jgi:hypothetical protein
MKTFNLCRMQRIGLIGFSIVLAQTLRPEIPPSLAEATNRYSKGSGGRRGALGSAAQQEFDG